MFIKSLIKNTADSVAKTAGDATSLIKNTAGNVAKTAGDATSLIKNTAGNVATTAGETTKSIGMKLARKAIMDDKKTAQAEAAVAALENAGLKTAGQDMSVEDAARLAGKLTGHGLTVETAIIAGKTVKDAIDTASVLGKKGIFSKSIFSQVRKNGQVTQDMLDAVLCDNKDKLAQAYSEAIRAEALGKPLPYLSEEEVEAALSLRKSVAKTLTRQFFS